MPIWWAAVADMLAARTCFCVDRYQGCKKVHVPCMNLFVRCSVGPIGIPTVKSPMGMMCAILVRIWLRAWIFLSKPLQQLGRPDRLMIYRWDRISEARQTLSSEGVREGVAAV